MNKRKEIAKFAAGLATWESIMHASLWISGSQPDVFGITLTTTINIIQTIIPGLVAVCLIRYAWLNKQTI
jgi:hypothetical protein